LNAPCHNCPDRHEGCHGKCERYLAYRAELESHYEERKAMRNMYDTRSYTFNRDERKRLNAAKRKGR